MEPFFFFFFFFFLFLWFLAMLLYVHIFKCVLKCRELTVLRSESYRSINAALVVSLHEVIGIQYITDRTNNLPSDNRKKEHVR